jgi:hypothetical protein
MTGARLDHGKGVFDLQQTAREETPQMVGSQRVCKRHFQGYSKAQRMDFDEQGYRQYSHIVRVSFLAPHWKPPEIARGNESSALTLWCVQVATISGVKVRANAKFDFVSCLEQDGKRQDVICRACGDDILATN